MPSWLWPTAHGPRPMAQVYGLYPGRWADYDIGQSMWAYAMIFSGTVLKRIIPNSEVYAFILLHTAVRLCYELIPALWPI